MRKDESFAIQYQRTTLLQSCIIGGRRNEFVIFNERKLHEISMKFQVSIFVTIRKPEIRGRAKIIDHRAHCYVASHHPMAGGDVRGTVTDGSDSLIAIGWSDRARVMTLKTVSDWLRLCM